MTTCINVLIYLWGMKNINKEHLNIAYGFTNIMNGFTFWRAHWCAHSIFIKTLQTPKTLTSQGITFECHRILNLN